MRACGRSRRKGRLTFRRQASATPHSRIPGTFAAFAVILFGTPALSFALAGDVNLDGLVNQADASTVGNYLVGNSSFMPSFANADVNQDGLIDTKDALILQQFVNGLRANLGGTSFTPICGNVSGTFAASASPYVATCNLTVPLGQTLTLPAGTVIKMSTGTVFSVNGTLVSQGTPDNLVYITSLRDDSILGDTAVDGPTAGSPGDWATLTFNNATAANQLSNTVVRFGQKVILAASSPQLNAVTIASMSVVAISADIASSVSGSGNVAFGSPVNGIDKVSGVITSAVDWTNVGLPYVIRQGRVFVDTGGQLTLAPGVIVKLQGIYNNGNEFAQAGIAAYRGGTLLSQGTVANPVILTSLKDDSVGGDTNNDGGSHDTGSRRLARDPIVGAWIKQPGQYDFAVWRNEGAFIHDDEFGSVHQ